MPMTNKQRFLQAQAVFNRRMAGRKGRRTRAIIVRVVYVACAAAALAMVVCTVFPQLRQEISMALVKVFSVFGMRF